MATQPNETVLWCTDTNDSDNNLLKVEPPTSVKTTGLIKRTPFARVWHNFYFNYICNGLGWVFDERYKVGAVVSFKDGTAPDFTEWRGTWASIGTSTIGSTTVNFYERTA